MLDHLSGGRLEIGFGRGSVPYEIAYYGQNAEERQDIYAERLKLRSADGAIARNRHQEALWKQK